MVENIERFWQIHDRAWEVANDPSYDLLADPLASEYFRAEAVGSTDEGQNAYADMKLLVERGSDGAKAALRQYARNLSRDGNKSMAGQARVELTGIDSWSVGAVTYLVVLRGHDVPAIRLTYDDIALLKTRSLDPLLILEIDNDPYLPLQWTRKSSLRKDVHVITVHNETITYDLKISDLKSY